MSRVLLCLSIILTLITPVKALVVSAPEVPESGRVYLNEEPESFGQGLWHIVKEAMEQLQPAIAEAGESCIALIIIIILLSLSQSVHGKKLQAIQLIGTVMISIILFGTSKSLIRLGETTVQEISNYGKLLLPVLTAALAAQGAVTASAGLYTGTALFNSLLSNLISTVIIPMLYVYLVFCVACNALGEDALSKLKDFIKWLMTWLLKTILYIYTGYLGITGVVSGSVDAAAMKATKLTISGMVPVVGGILSDASETILVSARVVKNSVGVYGLLALIALCIGPFIRIGSHYLLLKLTWVLCGTLGAKENVKLIGDFSGAMGLLLGMTGTVCLLFMVSTVCLLRCVSI